MQAQKIVIFAMLAGLLILQLSPMALARTSESSSTDDSTTGGGVSAECAVSIVNNVFTNLNNLRISAATALTLCPTQCALGTAQCIGCILGALPNLPMIPQPSSLPGCT